MEKVRSKNQKQSSTEMKFPTVNHKTRKKGYLNIHLFHK